MEKLEFAQNKYLEYVKGDQVEATLPGLSMLVKSSTFMALCAHSLEDNTNKKFSLK